MFAVLRGHDVVVDKLVAAGAAVDHGDTVSLVWQQGLCPKILSGCPSRVISLKSGNSELTHITLLVSYVRNPEGNISAPERAHLCGWHFNIVRQ